MNSKKRKTNSTKETSKKIRLIPEALLSRCESDNSDLDSDKDSDCGGGSYVDFDSILSSNGASDSEPTDLNDLGLLTELLNDEVNDKWKKNINNNTLTLTNSFTAGMTIKFIWLSKRIKETQSRQISSLGQGLPTLC